MGTQMKEDILLDHLNQVSGESVIQLWNQSHQSMTMQILTWDVDAAVNSDA